MLLDKPALARRMSSVRPSAIMELLKTAAGGDYLNLASGLPDASLFPVGEVREAAGHILTNDAAGALQYGAAEGFAPLRAWIAQRLRERGFISATPDSVLITNGSEQALDLSSRVLLDPGDGVCVESPTYAAALQTFDSCEVRYVVVRQDDEGMDVGVAATAIQNGCNLVYTLPNFQNPTGRTLSQERRKYLAHVVGETGGALIEDDAYFDLRYEGESLPPVGSLMNAGTALYLGSFSKSIAPGLRVGFVHGPPELIERMTQLKQIADLHTGSLAQRLVFRFIADGHFDRHVDELRRAYRAKRDRMLSALETAMPSSVSWTRPAGGMFIWVSLPERIDADKLLDRAMERRLLFVPGSGFCADGSGRNGIRLNFASPTLPQIDEGISILAGILREAGV